jgi:excisionase family DNA binding protein
MIDDEPVGTRPSLRLASQVLEYELVRVRDIASILDVSDGTVRKFIDMGLLRTTRVGRLLRITQFEALRFLATFNICPERGPRTTRTTHTTANITHALG